MSREVARVALELAAESGKPFHVQLAGGEPTLEAGLIEYIGSLIRREKWPATIALQTNGTRVDAALIDLCLRYEIEVGVSVDGPLEVQEQMRGDAPGTYRGLALLDAAGVPVRITSVLCSENVGRLSQLALSLASFSNIHGFGLDPLVRKGVARSRPDLVPDEASVQRAAGDLCSVMTAINQRRQRPLRWRELDAVRSALATRRCSPHFCHASRGESMAVHPSGAVYPCSQAAGEPELAAGTLDAVDWTRLTTALDGVRMRCHDTGCPLAGRCPGDCPSRLRWNWDEAVPVMCSLYRGIAHSLAEEIL
jgi:uncharacterized protein